MGKLSDILQNGQADAIREAWDSTAAAGELEPLPPGEYIAHIVAGTLENAKTRGTPGFKMTFRVCEGPHAGRQFWHDIWLTEAALPMAKRDFAKIGITSLAQLENPLPRGIRCKCKLTLQRADDGAEFNRVRSFLVVGIDEPEADAFAPDDGTPPGTPPGTPAATAAAATPGTGQSEGVAVDLSDIADL